MTNLDLNVVERRHNREGKSSGRFPRFRRKELTDGNKQCSGKEGAMIHLHLTHPTTQSPRLEPFIFFSDLFT